MAEKQTDPGLALEELERQAAEDGLGSDGREHIDSTRHNAPRKDDTTNTPKISETIDPKIAEQAAARAAEQTAAAKEPVSLGSKSLDDVFAGAQTALPNATPITKADAPLAIPDDQLVIFQGRQVPYGEIKNLVYFKDEFDRKNNDLQRREGLLTTRKAAIDQVMNYVDPILNAPGGKVFLETFSATGDLNKAIDVVSPIIGRRGAEAMAAGAQASAAAKDAALALPKDRDGNELPADDPEVLRWRAEVQGPELARRAAQSVIDKNEQAHAEKSAREQAIVDQKNAEAQRTAKFRSDVKERNKSVLRSLPDILQAKGINLKEMGVTQSQYVETVKGMLDYAEREAKMDIRDESWLEENEVTEGHLRALVDASGFIPMLRAKGSMLSPEQIAAAAANAGSNANRTNGNAATNGNATLTDEQLAARAAMPNGQRILEEQRRRQPINAMGAGDTVAAAPSDKNRIANPKQGVEEAYEELLRTARADGFE